MVVKWNYPPCPLRVRRIVLAGGVVFVVPFGFL
jgi:hypothetical protein